MDFSYIKLPKGIETRPPFDTELEYFRKNPSVAGMATEDNKVILNQFANLKPEEFQGVAINESARILMKKKPELQPTFDLTEQQKSFLDSTTYRNAPESARKATIAARILSKDPSAGIPSNEQTLFTSQLRKALGLD